MLAYHQTAWKLWHGVDPDAAVRRDSFPWPADLLAAMDKAVVSSFWYENAMCSAFRPDQAFVHPDLAERSQAHEAFRNSRRKALATDVA